jgi:hypothetical protein
VTGSGLTNQRSVGVPYKTEDGTWRMKFNLFVTSSSATTGFTLTISGVTFKNVTNYYQACTAKAYEIGVGDKFQMTARTAPGGSDIVVLSGSGNVNSITVSGDVELESKPTFVP